MEIFHSQFVASVRAILLAEIGAIEIQANMR